jgi:uncharacterized SAM-binding protein YcdF (DUF218 family)
MRGVNHTANIRKAATRLTIALLLALAVLPWAERPLAVDRWLGDALLPPLETRFVQPQIGDWTEITGLLVLGGRPERVHEALRLASAYPHLRVVLSGPAQDDLLPFETMPPSLKERVTIELSSSRQGTWGNALHTYRIVQPTASKRWLLITSAMHMPRAMGTFRAAGFNVEPWPVMDSPTYPPARARMAMHEWIGLLAYRILGRSNALFPKPLTPPGGHATAPQTGLELQAASR